MKIYLINHYAVPLQYYPLARPSLFAKNLIKRGHDVTIIAASTVHNSECQNLIEDGTKVKHITDDGIPYVLVNCKPYKGNGKDRVINIFQFAMRLSKVLDTLEKPDAIVATSFDPFTCYEGIKYAKKHGIKAVAEIADLWPETLVAYNGVSPMNPAVLFLRHVEKKIYTTADRIVFTMEGAYNYIVEQKWEKEIPKNKVYYINNGVDLEQFEKNKDIYQVEDDDLSDSESIKVVYAGSIKKANNVGYLLDVAKNVKNDNVVFLIWGDGEELQILKDRKEKENLTNVKFKGRVNKENIPFIISHSDINFLDPFDAKVAKYGISSNKLFEYIAAGKPILMNDIGKYNPAGEYCYYYDDNAEITAELIEKIALDDKSEELRISEGLKEIIKHYEFKYLTQKLLDCLQ